jgi:2-oxoglutarate dehydrogenase E1 component
VCKSCERHGAARRGFLGLAAALAGTAVETAATGAFAAHGPTTSVTPDEALERLKAGNRRYIAAPEVCAVQLAAQREKSGQTTTAIVRLEQLYPFPDGALTKTLAAYPNAKKFVWVQEEPRNMGAYRFAQAQLKELMGIDVDYVGRPDSASPAVGSQKQHAIEQDKILSQAIGAAKAGDGPAGGPGNKKETAQK